MTVSLRKGHHVVCRYNNLSETSNGDIVVGHVDSVRRDGDIVVTNLITNKKGTRSSKNFECRHIRVTKATAMSVVREHKKGRDARVYAVNAAKRDPLRKTKKRTEGPTPEGTTQEANGQMVMPTDTQSAAQASPVSPPPPQASSPPANNLPSMPEAPAPGIGKGLYREKKYNAMLFTPTIRSNGNVETKIIARAMLPRFASKDEPAVLLWKGRCFYRTSTRSAPVLTFLEVHAHTVSPTHVDEDVTSMAIDTERDLEGGSDES